MSWQLCIKHAANAATRGGFLTTRIKQITAFSWHDPRQ
jgi:hypothetical protein